MKLASAPLSLVDEDWWLEEQASGQHCLSASGGELAAGGAGWRRGAPYEGRKYPA